MKIQGSINKVSEHLSMLTFAMIIFITIAKTGLHAQAIDSTVAKPEPKPIYVVHVNLGNKQLANKVIEELIRNNPLFENRPIKLLRPDLDAADNPFAVSRDGRQMGRTRKGGKIKTERTPLLSKKALAWFKELELKKIFPEVFIMNGHHAVGIGFVSNSNWKTTYTDEEGNPIYLYNRSLYTPTLIETAKKGRLFIESQISENKAGVEKKSGAEYAKYARYAVVTRFFDRIKLVFLGGCESLTNLEPHEFGSYGRALGPVEIKNRYESGDAKLRELMLGHRKNGASLLGYRSDLALLYPDGFTTEPDKEVCIDSENKLNCRVLDVNRVMPDSGLWDGGHTYNIALQMKDLVPNAFAVFGFFTPSPLNPGAIWQAAFDEARRRLGTENFFQEVLAETTPEIRKKEIIQQMRISWTEATRQMNKRKRFGKIQWRISGSITPAFPDLDANGLFAYDLNSPNYPEGPIYAPYEIRETPQDHSITGGL